MRAVTALLAAAALCLAAACQHSEERYLKRDVAAPELIGTWQMTDGTVQDLRDAGYTAPVDPKQHTIDLRADGTCRFRTLLEVPSSPSAADPLRDAACHWHLGKVGHQALQLELDPPAAGSPYYYFGTGAGGTLVLWQYAGDPDAWRYVEYSKR